MIRFNKFVAVAAMIAASAATAGAQGTISATKPVAFGVSAGASIPTGDLADAANTGYNVAGHVLFGTPSIPFKLRGDVGYHSFGGKSDVCQGTDCSASVLAVTGNLVYDFPMPTAQIRPYVLGGAGLYQMKAKASASGVSVSSSENDFGFQLGGGLVMPLSGFNAFVEAKYTQVQMKDNAGSAKFVPISFGVMF